MELETRKKILIVEDDRDIASLMQAIFEGEGEYSTQICTSVADALTAVERFLPDLVVMDVDLKEAVDGIELYEWLKKIFRKNTAQMPMMIVSAMSGPEYKRRAEEAGARDYILKPFEPEDLLQATRRALSTC